MTARLIDLRQARRQTTEDLPGLRAYLAVVVGEAFRFARVSYGDELTLHFGDLRPARSPKLMGQPYGAYILGVRGSPWLLKGGNEPLVVSAGVLLDPLPADVGKLLSKEDLEANPLIHPESRVLALTPFVVKPVNAFGLQLQVSDGSGLVILPTVQEADDSDNASLPALADWELLSPAGLLSAGPGLQWSFEPSADRTPRPGS